MPEAGLEQVYPTMIKEDSREFGRTRILLLKIVCHCIVCIITVGMMCIYLFLRQYLRKSYF